MSNVMYEYTALQIIYESVKRVRPAGLVDAALQRLGRRTQHPVRQREGDLRVVVLHCLVTLALARLQLGCLDDLDTRGTATVPAGNLQVHLSHGSR